MAKKILDDLQAAVTAETDQSKAAVLFMNGIAERQQAAIDQALANGATAEELAPITAMNAELVASKDALAAAIVANTPATALVDPPVDGGVTEGGAFTDTASGRSRK